MLSKKIVLFSLLLCEIVAFTACTSGKRAFENGDYGRAIYLAVDRLRRTPEHSKSRHTLDKAYQLYIKKNESDVKNIEASVHPFKWDDIVNIYQNTHAVYDQIRACPAALEVVPQPVRYDERLQTARRNAAEAHYEAGITDLSLNKREKARSAYFQFQKAQEFFPNIKSDILARMTEAKQKATLRVAVFYSPIAINFNLQKYSLVDAITRNEIDRYTQDLDKREFIDAEMIPEPTPQQEVEDLVRLAYTQFNPEQPQYKETVEQRFDSVRIERTSNGQTFVSYEKVWAEIAIREKSVRTTGMFEVLINDAETAQILFNQSVSDEYIWTHRWATLRNGDQRALTEEQRKLLQQSEQLVPSYQMLFDELQRKIAGKTKEKISEYYKGY